MSRSRPASPGATQEMRAATNVTGAGAAVPAWPFRFRPAAVPAFFTLALLAFLPFPPVRDNARLAATFVGVALVLGVWQVFLWRSARRGRRTLAGEVSVVKAHYVQGLVQFCIFVYWGWHSRGVYAEAPLILAQVLYFYVFGALLAWTRGHAWRFGFGPLPIVFSTNLLLWFRPDWFFFQFAMISAGALGKEFVQWKREGRRTHVFNPSVFGQVLVALVLIFTGTTTTYTMGEEIAVSFESLPHILPLLFALGLVVQSMFAVTLMTLSGTAVLYLLNLVYTEVTGSYYFVTLNVGATIFLGLHLLLTDPSTSPRSNLGRVIFGALYGLGYAVLFRLFDGVGVSLFWDKLLPVPILNLMVPLLDRLARSGPFGRFNRRWEGALAPRTMNLVHMGCWCAMFATMIGTGFVNAPHEGRTIAFWRQAYEEGRARAGKNLLDLVNHRAAHGSGIAANMLGRLHLEGDLVPQDLARSAHWFANACEWGYGVGCENVVGLYLFQRRAESLAHVDRAFDHLERLSHEDGPDGTACYLLGLAYELGMGRPKDRTRAAELYEIAAARGHPEATQQLVRVRAQASLSEGR